MLTHDSFMSLSLSLFGKSNLFYAQTLLVFFLFIATLLVELDVKLFLWTHSTRNVSFFFIHF